MGHENGGWMNEEQRAASETTPAPEREPEGDIASAPVGCWFPILFGAMLVGFVLLENC